MDAALRRDTCAQELRTPRGRANNYPTWYPIGVRKTSVYLSAEETSKLAKLAEREGSSQAEVIRRAIRMVCVGDTGRPELLAYSKRRRTRWVDQRVDRGRTSHGFRGVTLILDAAPLVALADRRDPIGQQIETLLQREPGELVVPAPVTAEVDYLLGQRLGRGARVAFLDDLAVGRFTVGCLEAEDHEVVIDLERRYADLDVGLPDLSVVVLSLRDGARADCSPSTIATFVHCARSKEGSLRCCRSTTFVKSP